MTYLRFALPLIALVGLFSLYVLWQRAETQLLATSTELTAANRERERLATRNQDLEREAIERLADDAAIEKLGKGMTDAINATTPAQQAATPSAVSVALGCARLREAGATSDAFKRICGAGQTAAGAKAPAH